MATLSQYLVNQNLEQPRPKFVPPPSKTQAVALYQGVHRIRVIVNGRQRRPKHLLLGTINHCDFRVVKAIPVHLEVRGKTVIASWRQVDEFGTGKSTSLACDDLGHTVAELYVSLERDEPRLGPDLANVWGVLKQHIVRRPHESS